MQTIWKFNLPSDGRLVMPRGAKILCVQVQEQQPRIWALVDPEQPMVKTLLRIYGTGQPIPSDPGQYIGTFLMLDGALVWHVFQSEETPDETRTQ